MRRAQQTECTGSALAGPAAPAADGGAVREGLPRRLAHLSWAALLVVLIATAWMCDDAFITFRTVRNLAHGHGLTWNPGQRVQAYTHPSWMLLSLLGYTVSGECYFSVLAISFALAVWCTAALVHSDRPQTQLTAAVLLGLSASRAYMDYSICGLENPLLFLLLVLFARQTARSTPATSLTRNAWLMAFITLTRQDALLLVGPSYAQLAWRRTGRRAALRETLLGLTPLWIWEAFSLVYYGTLVPNTAFAKLNISVAASERYGHGLAYLGNSLRHDPITLVSALGLCMLLARSRERRLEAAVAGALLYLAYIVNIGGDFMSGRFCAAPLVWTLAAAMYAPGPRQRLQAAARTWWIPCVLVYVVVWPQSPWHVQVKHDVAHRRQQLNQPDGIADERLFYYSDTGLLPVIKHLPEIRKDHLPIPPFHTASAGLRFATDDRRVNDWDMIGFYGYFAGDKHVVDIYGLADPFLARIPFRTQRAFRPGHYFRELPKGYLASIASGRNRLEDPELARLYDCVQSVVTGPLFSSKRLRNLLCYNLLAAP